MSAVNTEWVVQPHGPLQQLAENLWCVEGVIRMPPGPLPRRMTIARLDNSNLVVFSAVAVREEVLKEIESLGRPAVLIVPNAFHRLDAPSWKARFPDMKVLTPRGARSGVNPVVRVDSVADDLGDPKVSFVSVPGTTEGEAAMVVNCATGTTLVLNDLIGNVRGARGLMRIALALMGFGGREPQVPRAFSARMVKDKGALAAQFRAWAAMPGLRQIVVSHGDIISDDPAGLLRRLADKLS